MSLLRKFRALWRRKKLDAEMAEEMRLHLEMQAERNRATGMESDEARDAALRQFGNVASVQEHCREQRGWLWLEQLRQDLRFGLRGLAKSPGYSSVAMVTLAVGIGTTTAIFSVLYGVLISPYPYARSGEIWAPEIRDSKTGRGAGFRMADYLEMSRLPGVASAMATRYSNTTLSGGVNPEIITAPRVTATAFGFLDVPPVLGRGLTPADIRADGTPERVTVISFKLWHRLFNADPAVLGKTLVLDDEPHVIVGVMPPRFGWYTDDGLWLPLATTDLQQGVRPIVRLKPGVSSEVASQQLLALLQEQAKASPDRFPKEGFTAFFNNYLNVTVASGEMRASLILLICAVGFLLLIACTNVANLQLARGAGRGRELAVRLALGASRGRLGRQLLTESVVLSLTGGVLGVLLAVGMLELIVRLLPENTVPNEARVTINGWVLAFSTVLSVFTGIVAGLFPAWQCTKPDVNEALKDGTQGAGNLRGNRTRQSLAVAQITLSVVLLVAASLTTLGFLRAQSMSRGLNTDKMLLLRVPLAPKRYTTYEQRMAFVRDFTDRLRNQPGVEQVSMGLPPGVDTRSGVTIPGQPKPANGLALNYVDADYLSTYGIQLKDGRYFTAQEIARKEHVALVNESAAKAWTNGDSPIGHTISVDALIGGDVPAAGAVKEVTIIGILKDVYTEGPLKPAPAVVFVPHTLRAFTNRFFTLRTQVEPSSLVNTVRGELRAMDKEQPMARPFTFEEIIEEQAKQPRFSTALFSLMAGVALLLAAAGIYSVLSYAVAQRVREIGVRMALGASARDVQRLFVKSGVRLVVIGLVIGVPLSVGIARILRNQIVNGPWLDPLAFGIAIGLLSLTVIIACLIPARRATKVDPLVALRAE